MFFKKRCFIKLIKLLEKREFYQIRILYQNVIHLFYVSVITIYVEQKIIKYLSK